MGKRVSEDWSADNEFQRLMVVAAATLVVGLIGCFLAVLPWAVLRSLGIVLVTVVAGGMGGAAMGFLFGIPRVLTDAGAAAGAAAESAAADAGEAAAGDSGSRQAGRRLLASNSNLEQVSDWLTKIILGVGLTQLYQLNGLLVSFRDLVRNYVPPADQVTPLITTIMLVFAVIVGFLSMYLETRLVLSRIFNTVEAILANVLRENRRIAIERQAAQTLASDLQAAVVNIAADPSSSPASLAAAADSLKSVAQSDQVGSDIRSIAAQALAASGRTGEANELLPSSDNATVQDQIAAMQVALYAPPPNGFQEVARIAAGLNDSEVARGSAEYWFYQGAAFGQQHHYLLEHGGSEDDRQRARDNALDCARRCVALDENFKIRVFWLLNPQQSPNPSDDDLSDFKKDKEFQNLVKLVSPATPKPSAA